jgi:hypothetical protein
MRDVGSEDLKLEYREAIGDIQLMAVHFHTAAVRPKCEGSAPAEILRYTSFRRLVPVAPITAAGSLSRRLALSLG